MKLRKLGRLSSSTHMLWTSSSWALPMSSVSYRVSALVMCRFEQANLDITSLSRTMTFFVSTKFGYIFLTDESVITIGIGHGRMFRFHLDFKRKIKELATLFLVFQIHTLLWQGKVAPFRRASGYPPQK